MAQAQECAPKEAPVNRRGSLKTTKSGGALQGANGKKTRRSSTSSLDTGKALIGASNQLNAPLSKGTNSKSKNGTVASSSKKGNSESTTKKSNKSSSKTGSNKGVDGATTNGKSSSHSRKQSLISEVTSVMDGAAKAKKDGSKDSRHGTVASPKQTTKSKVSKSSSSPTSKQKRRSSTSSTATETTIQTTKGTKASKSKSGKNSKDSSERGFVESDEMNNSMPSRGSDTDLDASTKAKMSKWPSCGDLADMVNKEREKIEGEPRGSASVAPNGSAKTKSGKAKRRGSAASSASQLSKSSKSTVDLNGKKKGSNSSVSTTKTTSTKKKKSDSMQLQTSLFTLDEESVASGKTTSTKKSRAATVADPLAAADRFEASFGLTPAFPTFNATSTTTPSTSSTKGTKKKPAATLEEEMEKVKFQDFFPKQSGGGATGGDGDEDDDDNGLLGSSKGKKNRAGKTRYKRGKVGPNPTFKLRGIFGKKKAKEGFFYPDDDENDEGHLLGSSH